ncbi:hypothetical protein RZS08_16420, partial [Arthrospira platensis SPKY1]|nr:hypothetical protein [Arthrospira platensis SPKY1]
MHPKSDSNPVWSADGSKLYFQSDRNNGDTDVWFAWLREADALKSKEDHEQGMYFETDTKDSGKKKKDVVSPIQIDTDRIYERLVQVTRDSGSESVAGTDEKGEYVYFSAENTTNGQRDLFKVKWNGEDRQLVTKNGANPAGTTMADGGKYLYYISRGR